MTICLIAKLTGSKEQLAAALRYLSENPGTKSSAPFCGFELQVDIPANSYPLVSLLTNK